MRKRGLPYLILAVLALALPAGAAATPEPMPGQVEMHVSCRSPMALLQNIDAYVAASTKGTAKAVPPGFVGMMAQLYTPIPLDSWDSDGEVHVITMRTPGEQDAKLPMTVVVFGCADVAAFIESVEERGWMVGEMAEDERFAAVVPVVLPNGMSMNLADLGDGRAALGFSADRIGAALDGWTPAHSSASDVVFNIALDADGSALARVAMERLEKEKNNLVTAISESGFKPELAENLIVTLEKYIPLLTDEVGNLKNVVMEAAFADDAMLLDFSLRPGAGTMLGEIGGTVSKGKNVDVSLAERLPAGAVTAAVSAGVADIIPNTRNRLTKWAAGFYGGILPEFRDRLAGQVENLMDGGPEQTAVANYFADGRQYSLSISKAESPEKFLAAILSMMGTLNDMWAAAIADPGYGLEFVGEERETGGLTYVVYRPVFADPDRFQELMDRITDNSPEMVFDVALLSRMRLYLAGLEDGVLSASGELTDEDFAARFARVKAPSGDSLIATERAKEAIAGLANAQVMAGVFDAGGTFGLYAAQELRTARSRFGEVEAERMAAAIDAHLKNRKSNGEVVGIGLGAENGWLNLRTLVPAGVVSQVIRDVDGFERAKKNVESPSGADREADDGEEAPEEVEAGDEEDSEAA